MSASCQTYVDFFTPVHRGLRQHLFRLAIRTESTDFTNPLAVRVLLSDVQNLLAALHWHAEIENRFFQPLIGRALPEVHAQLQEEHRILQDQLRALEQHINRIAQRSYPGAGHKFNRVLMRFIAEYLLHMDAEEETMPVLRERVPHEELAMTVRAANAQRPAQPVETDVPVMTAATVVKHRGDAAAWPRPQP